MKDDQLGERRNMTYRIGLLQTKAFRILQSCTTEYLKDNRISPVDWAFLGLLYDAAAGVRPSNAAEVLGVEAPYITQLIKALKAKGLIKDRSDTVDGRAKLVELTAKGKKYVIETENMLRGRMAGLSKGISLGELAGYLSVLHKFIQNFDEMSGQDGEGSAV